MMSRTRSFIRSLLALLLVAACFAALVVPLLGPVRAAPQAQAAVPNHIVISEFRSRGPNGTPNDPGNGDEFIELYNPTGGDLTIGQDWTLAKSSGCQADSSDFYTFPSPVTLHSGQHYLIGGKSYSGSVTPDVQNVAIQLQDEGSIGLLTGPDTDLTRVVIDQVGMCDIDDTYVDPPALDPLSGLANQSYDRIAGSGGSCQDTDHNKNDFFLRRPSDPQNMSSPITTCGNPTPTPITPTSTPSLTPTPRPLVIRGNVQAPGVVLSYVDGILRSVTSNADGSYEISISRGWSGKVTPDKGGYTFSPSHIDYSNITTNQNNQDYTAIQDTPSYQSVLINEVGWMGTRASAADQWVELYNPNNYAVNISSLHLYGYGIGTDDDLALSGMLTDDILLGHGFLLIEQNSGVFKNLPPSSYKCSNKIRYTFTAKTAHVALSTTYEYPYLSLGTASYVYAVDYVLQTRWPAGIGGSGVSAASRASMERHNQDPPSPYAWFNYAGTTTPCPQRVQDRDGDAVKGTPGEPNWAQSGITATPSPVPTHYKTPTPLPPTPFAHMVINEFLPRAGFDYNQDGSVDVFDEFVELKNLGPITGQLSGWRIDVISPGGTSSYSLSGVSLQTNERAVFYSSQTHLSLYDSGGTLRLINSRGVIVDARSYGAVQSPDQSICRIPDGYYWRFPCFPTPGLQNSLTGKLPVPPPVIASKPPPCLLADTVPDPFRQAECYGFGEDVFNPAYWDDQAGFNSFPVPDVIDKNGSEVK